MATTNTINMRTNHRVKRVTVDFGPGWWLLPSVLGGGYIWYCMISALIG